MRPHICATKNRSEGRIVVGYRHAPPQETPYAKALSQRELAKLAGMSHTTINRLELGKQQSTFKSIRKLAAVLGVEPGELEVGE